MQHVDPTYSQDELGTLNNTLCIKTPSTNGEGIAKAILLIGLDQIAAATKDTVRKVKFLHTLPEGDIFREIP